MNNQPLMSIEKGIAIFCCVIAFLFFVLLIGDMAEFVNHPSKYANLYQQDSTDQSWKMDYLNNELITMGSCLGVIGLSLWRVVRPSKIIRIVSYVMYLVIVIMICFHLYNWAQTGFDVPKNSKIKIEKNHIEESFFFEVCWTIPRVINAHAPFGRSFILVVNQLLY